MKKRDVKTAPWRMKYLQGKGIQGCFVCEALGQEPSEQNLVIIKSPNSAVMLNRYPYNNGHLMIVPRIHAATLQDIQADTINEMMYWVRTAEAILKKTYNADGFNVGINIGSAAGAGLADHLHIHILPRWKGDTNFMTTIGDCRVVPELHGDTWNRLTPLFREQLEAVDQ